MLATTGSSRNPLRGPLYLDASALVKLYVPEPESDELNRKVLGRRDLLVSDLAVTEIVSSLCRRRREGAVGTPIVVRLHQAVLDHIEAGVYRRVEMLPAAFRDAERFLLSIENAALRAADALHLALAVSGEAKAVLTYDRRMGRAASALGLNVFPETRPSVERRRSP